MLDIMGSPPFVISGGKKPPHFAGANRFPLWQRQDHILSRNPHIVNSSVCRWTQIKTILRVNNVAHPGNQKVSLWQKRRMLTDSFKRKSPYLPVNSSRKFPTQSHRKSLTHIYRYDIITVSVSRFSIRNPKYQSYKVSVSVFAPTGTFFMFSTRKTG